VAGVWSTRRTVCVGAAVGLLAGPFLGYAFETELRTALAPWLSPVQSVIFAKAPTPIVVVPIPTFSAAPVVVTPTVTAEHVPPPSPQAPRSVKRRPAAVPPPAPQGLGGPVERGSTVTVTQTSQAPRTADPARRAAARPPSASQIAPAPQRVTATVTVTRTPTPTSTSNDVSTSETTTSESATESSAALREVGLESSG
jgi:hypothetical protein